MNQYLQIVEEIKASNHIVITAHKSPDGDSVGSSLGLLHFIEKLGKTAVVCHPDPAPDFLAWLENIDQILTITQHQDLIKDHFEKADLVFCLDYNGTDRVGPEMQAMLEQASCKKIMIDHHLNPQDFATITVSETAVCSTSQLIVELIVQSENTHLLNGAIGTPLYLGILTDTGSFRFPSVQPRTHQLLAMLLEAGVKHHVIHENLNDNNTLGRLKIQGYALSEKLEVVEEYQVAIISLTNEELVKYNYQKGDTDALVNLALSIKGMKAAMFFSERDGMIKISFRSKGKENPVNTLASEHFSGGGHANAAGGMSELSMEATLEKVKSLLPLYFSASPTV
jgi:phosphoesterase RecJ-like protein